MSQKEFRSEINFRAGDLPKSILAESDQSWTSTKGFTKENGSLELLRQNGASLVYWWISFSVSIQNPVRLMCRLCSRKRTF